ncbi:3'(2'),5'-bisphosphate nucleotidase CysQ [Fulvimarina endophytica]|uniref:3'(2'),5'-bisphosphate nucleotidase CysQ n=1 Tax=Fulvimarina endophytica TaxID=2293836 RepID=A0A371X816_9HYPH|nr:3'(2'),5'-bisphosphate nucleotidase CysQ [Fulvimarina endophytica]RFC65356.1 3'(2'),5'-bisphosphate nucleotidase CysQ [Fulvimarina endophytica]
MSQTLPSETEELDLLEDAAREAGRIAMSYFGRDPEVWWKANDSPVSEGDYAVDSYLKERLLKARADYGWVSEESVLDGTASTEHEDRFFIVDPIDGTRAYLRGDATWCVSIALVSGDRPLAGAVFAPVPGEMFTVTRSGEARLNGEPCRAGAATEGHPMSVAMPDQFRSALRRLDAAGQERVSAQIGAPSLAYRLCQVAAGRLDATLVRPRAHDWDIAAGDLLLEKSDAALVDCAGEAIRYTRSAKRHGLLVAASKASLSEARELASALSR